MKKKFKVVTLGCRTNQYESQAYRTQLETLGYTAVQEGEPADLCIVNTCTVTEAAHQQSQREIKALVKKNPGAKVVVTGCAAEAKPELFEGISGVSQLIPNKEKENLIPTVFPQYETFPEFAIQQFDAHTRAFVKVQDGCNSYCTYCIIPYVRGRSRSRTVEEVVAEVEGLIAKGYKEVVLTGINIGDFDGQASVSLAELVCAVDRVSGLQRLRLSSIDPDEVDEPLMEAILGGQHTCPSMHIVLQSGSNVVLKRMNRKYTRQIFFDTVDKLRKASPDFTFTTDVIVGFPGETETDFADTLSVMQEVQFAKVHMFPFSPRPRTRAALMKDPVPHEVIKERKQKLLRLSEKMAYNLREGYVGKTVSVLTEKRDSATEISGHTDNFLSVRVQSDQHQQNEIVEVTLTENSPTGLVGELFQEQQVAAI